VAAKAVIASEAKQSMAPHEEWIASSQGLLAMTQVAKPRLPTCDFRVYNRPTMMIRTLHIASVFFLSR
jgi:hypothetical protein